MMKNENELKNDNLEALVESVVNTFKFRGIEIKGMELSPGGVPCFKVIISKNKKKKSLQDTLDFAYWALWVLLYGKYSEDKKDLKLNLLYEEL